MQETGIFEARLKTIRKLIEAKLEEILNGREGILGEAMRYAVLGGGKRLRPFLMIETVNLFDVPQSDVLDIAAAIECLHAYSLIHDDLPAMDDDDVRHDQPTAHKRFDESTAILAGDALQSLAFEILSDAQTHPDPVIRSGLVSGLARAAGRQGMAGGQQMDMDAERTAPDMKLLERIQALKTGALVRFSVEAGVLVGKASVVERELLLLYADKLSLSLQISDDVLDIDQDIKAGKTTFATLLGEANARKRIQREIESAVQALESFGGKADTLCGAAEFMLHRNA